MFICVGNMNDMCCAGSIVEGHMVTFHITNECSYPIWPAIAPNAGHPVIADGGFLPHSDLTKLVQVPAAWNGRFWGRTGCNFTSTSNPACKTGDCGWNAFLQWDYRPPPCYPCGGTFIASTFWCISDYILLPYIRNPFSNVKQRTY